MMVDLQGACRALEVVPGLAATKKEWELRSGAGFPLLNPVLRPVGGIAECMPCFNHQLGLHYHDVIEHRDGTAEAGFRDEFYDCPSFPVERHERAILKPDMGALGRLISGALGLEDVASLHDAPEQCYVISRYHPIESFRFEAILSLCPTDIMSEESLLQYAALHAEPFIFLTATPKHIRGEVEAMLVARDVIVVPLTESIVMAEDCRLDATPSWHRAIERFRSRTVPSREPYVAFFETPANTKWESVTIRFVDGHTVFVSAAGASGRFNYAEMGMANRKASRPSVIWEFLRELAENHGSIDFDMGNPAKNKSWKSGLSDDLRRFFHIADDPFIYDKTTSCWQARFRIACE